MQRLYTPSTSLQRFVPLAACQKVRTETAWCVFTSMAIALIQDAGAGRTDSVFEKVDH